MKDATTKREYDMSSAVTFFLVGLGMGALLTLVSNPRTEQGIRRENWRAPATQPGAAAREPAA
jgi:hypothetical protein